MAYYILRKFLIFMYLFQYDVSFDSSKKTEISTK